MLYDPADDRDPDWTFQYWPPIPGTYSYQLWTELSPMDLPSAPDPYSRVGPLTISSPMSGSDSQKML